MGDRNVVIQKKTINRLVSDISDIIKNPLHINNIYYEHDEENILVGYAMIVGPEDTPYYGGFYFFKFNYPHNYPHSPPKVTYYTNDGVTRFNPNLYKSGKVCLSVLNTWRGEGWTGCQTISSILLTLSSILNENPLLNEPGIKECHRDFKNYNNIIQFKNYEVALIRMLNKQSLPEIFYMFHDKMIAIYIQNYAKYVENIITIMEKDNAVNGVGGSDESKCDMSGQSRMVSIGIYGMSAYINYGDILENMEFLYQSLVK